MKNTYLKAKEFNDNWSHEVSEVMDLYEKISEYFPDFGLLKLDFTFQSDKDNKLQNLAKSLASKFSIKNAKIERSWWKFNLSADTSEFPFTKDNFTYWLIAFYEEGFSCDCKLVGYGALTNPNNITFLDYSTKKEKFYFNKAFQDFENKNLWGAIVNWSNTIKVNPSCYQAYKNIGDTKDKLHLPFDAMKAYQKALEIKPDFVSALINLGDLKDRFKEYEIALNLYNKAISIDPENPMSYFNKGNTMFNLKNKKEACKLWHQAKELGAKYAQKRIDMECKK